MRRDRVQGRWLSACCLVVFALACHESPARSDNATDAPEASAPATDTVRVVVAGAAFDVEVAADPQTRLRGLSGRGEIAPDGGMLFVLPSPEPMAMVMRDCPNAIDVAFIDALGRVVAIHEMPPEAPRGAGESRRRYERRLPAYASGPPVSFALETRGGRLAEVGLEVGARLHFPAQALIARARKPHSTP
jgi:uncharacterized membrane protein (UPF0127 family)